MAMVYFQNPHNHVVQLRYQQPATEGVQLENNHCKPKEKNHQYLIRIHF